jgi:MATE family multidrug resistance protein
MSWNVFRVPIRPRNPGLANGSPLAAVTEELRRLVALAAPVVATQIGMMLLGVVDALMVGRVGVDALAAAALGNVWVVGTALAGMGLVLGVDPLISQAHGARDAGRMGLALQQGLVVAGLISLPTIGALAMTEQGLLLLGQSPELARLAHRYAVVQIPSVPAFLMFVACRQYLQNRGLVTPAMWIMLAANGVNAALNGVLIFGKLGFPELGLIGSGIATTVTRWFALAAIAGWILVFRLHRDAWLGWDRRALSPGRIGEVLRYGAPVGVQLALEIWAFQVATLMAGRFGAEALAGHTIVLNLASLSFMMPLGVSIGAATRVGNLIGAGRARRAQLSAWVAFGLGAGLMTAAASVFVLARHWLPRAYTAEVPVLAIAASLLPIAAAFQLFDGIQVVGGGVLRGMGRTLPAAVFNFVGYYVLAFPVGAFLAFGTSIGVAGIWWGLCVGLSSVAVMLLAWIRLRGPARVDARIA